ncbi:hypothetical protein DSECCO2_645590 [anaerobic digester metagenome]
MKIPGEVEIDIFHGQYLAPAPACSTALYSKDRAQRRLTQSHNGLFTDLVQRLRKADGDCGFTLTGRSGGDG